MSMSHAMLHKGVINEQLNNNGERTHIKLDFSRVIGKHTEETFLATCAYLPLS